MSDRRIKTRTNWPFMFLGVGILIEGIIVLAVIYGYLPR